MEIWLKTGCLKRVFYHNEHQGQHKEHKVLLISNIILVFFVYTLSPLVVKKYL